MRSFEIGDHFVEATMSVFCQDVNKNQMLFILMKKSGLHNENLKESECMDTDCARSAHICALRTDCVHVPHTKSGIRNFLKIKFD